MLLADAKRLRRGQTIYSRTHTNADGTPQRFKVNGSPKMWTTRPTEVRVPLKRGLYEFGYMDEATVGQFCLDEREAA